MTSTLIKNGRLIDPAQQLDRQCSLLIEDGRFAAYDVAENGQDVVLDAAGQIVAPGLIDLHTQLREPGWEEDETIDSGTRAALQGGFTSVACLPNTDPPLDTQAGVQFVRQKAARARHCRVHVLACVSKSREGRELAEIGSLVEAGAAGFTDALRPLSNTGLMRRALQYCQMFDKPVFSHPEVRELSSDGVMHEGLTSLVLGLAGMPAEAEDVMTGRDIRLAEATEGRLHLMDISTAGSVDLIRRAKSRGVRITAGICSPYLALDDTLLRSFDSNLKLNPPLRSKPHIAALIEGLADGTIDVISSGHAPRASEKKMQELDRAPFGMVSLETTLALINVTLIEPGHLTWSEALAKMTVNPARVLGLPLGTLEIGAAADVTVFDPQRPWTVQAAGFASRSRNTPLQGWQLRGRATHVLVDGELRHSAEKSETEMANPKKTVRTKEGKKENGMR